MFIPATRTPPYSRHGGSPLLVNARGRKYCLWWCKCLDGQTRAFEGSGRPTIHLRFVYA